MNEETEKKKKRKEKEKETRAKITWYQKRYHVFRVSQNSSTRERDFRASFDSLITCVISWISLCTKIFTLCVPHRYDRKPRNTAVFLKLARRARFVIVLPAPIGFQQLPVTTNLGFNIRIAIENSVQTETQIRSEIGPESSKSATLKVVQNVEPVWNQFWTRISSSERALSELATIGKSADFVFSVWHFPDPPKSCFLNWLNQNLQLFRNPENVTF